MSSKNTVTESLTGTNVYLALTLLLQAILGVGLVLFIWRGNWENVFLTVFVIVLTLVPAFLRREYRIYIPPEFQLIAAAFVFLSLFLGSATDFYYKLWWWDIVLHTSSGFLLGIVGYLALFVLNGSDKLPKGIRPIFVCTFGVMFAVSLGVVWEIIEFAIDEFFPSVNMQSRETGVVDTMEDLIVDLIGAIIVAVGGWIYYKTGRHSFLADGVNAFLARNKRLFAKRKEAKRSSAK